MTAAMIRYAARQRRKHLRQLLKQHYQLRHLRRQLHHKLKPNLSLPPMEVEVDTEVEVATEAEEVTEEAAAAASATRPTIFQAGGNILGHWSH